MSTHQRPERDAPVLPEALHALTAAARRSRTRPRRRLLRRRVGLLGLAALLVSGTAVAATHPWAGLFQGKEHATIATDPLPAAQLHAFGILRRPQTDADRSHAVKAAVRRMYEHASLGEQNVHLEGVRVLDQTPDQLYFLVPVGSTGDPRGEQAPTNARIPTRRNQLCLGVATASPQMLTFDGNGHYRTVGPKEGRVPLTSPDLRPEDLQISQTCASVADVRRGRGSMMNPMTGEFWGLIPDGPVAVQITSYRGEIARGTVKNNLYRITRPTDRPGFRGRPIRGVMPNGRLR